MKPPGRNNERSSTKEIWKDKEAEKVAALAPGYIPVPGPVAQEGLAGSQDP